jgi:hypothetical protein
VSLFVRLLAHELILDLLLICHLLLLVSLDLAVIFLMSFLQIL